VFSGTCILFYTLNARVIAVVCIAMNISNTLCNIYKIIIEQFASSRNISNDGPIFCQGNVIGCLLFGQKWSYGGPELFIFDSTFTFSGKI
jgi:hypothetical protein